MGKWGRNPKYETIKKLADIFNTTTEALNGRYDGIEEIVKLLNEYDLTVEDKNEIYNMVKKYLKEKKYE